MSRPALSGLGRTPSSANMQASPSSGASSNLNVRPADSHLRRSSAPSAAFSNPLGLFSPAKVRDVANGLLTPGVTTPGGGTNRRPSKSSRSFYKEKDEGSIGGGGFFSPRRDTAFDLTTRGVPAAGQTSWRVPRILSRLFSRRSRVLPAILLGLIVFFYALGEARRGSLYDKAQRTAIKYSPQGLNPLRWAQLSSGQAQTAFMQRFDVESSDPAGPDAPLGQVGMAKNRYKSWEGSRPDGRILIKEGEKHPIPMLMARAKQRWYALKNRQSKTFAQAVSVHIYIVLDGADSLCFRRFGNISGGMAGCHQKVSTDGMHLRDIMTFSLSSQSFLSTDKERE